MKLQTKIPIQKQDIKRIDYNSKIVLLGSCFSENIGNKFKYFKFQSTQNPLGILFHPKAIENLILNVINKKEYSQNDLRFQNERWHCFDAHSSLSSIDKNEILKNLNLAILNTHQKIKDASHIFITLGTAWVYRFKESGKIVANCHKIPQKKFSKEILQVDEIYDSLSAIIKLIRTVNRNVEIVFSVSPVRHIKDGFVENMQSKSHLISAIHKTIKKKKSAYYFPSYEIMMDELRDYRFYSEDMIHPNKTAINYIWDKFLATWFLEETLPTLKEVDAIQRGISHKSFNENSKEHQLFLKNLNAKKTKLQERFYFMKF